MDIMLITVRRILDERKQEILREQAREGINLGGHGRLIMTGRHAEELFEVETAIRAVIDLDNCYHIRMGTQDFNNQVSLCASVLSHIDRALPINRTEGTTNIINTHLYLALENLNLALEYIS